MAQSELLEVVRAAAPLLAAGIAGVVAWKFGSIQAGIARQQAETAAASAKTARNKLKLDLFERRWAIYKIASASISAALSGSGLTNEEEYEYQKAIRGARWIFDKDVETYLEVTLWRIFIDYNLACHNAKNCGISDDRSALFKEQMEWHRDLASQVKNIDKVFDKYLQLES